jgi:hypothetical protein
MSKKRRRDGPQRAPSEADMAESVANDVAEGIDNGESRRKLRRAVQYFALQLHYERQDRMLAESRLAAMKLGLALMNSAIEDTKKGRPCRNTTSK